MFFVGTIFIAVGYTLVYAGVKGDSYTVGGVPVWRRPWLPFVDIFSGHALTGGAGPTSTPGNPGDAELSAFVQTAPGGAPSSSPSSPPAPTTGGGTFL